MAEDFKANNLYILLSKKFDELYWYKAIRQLKILKNTLRERITEFCS